jgi:hypothetical protein
MVAIWRSAVSNRYSQHSERRRYGRGWQSGISIVLDGIPVFAIDRQSLIKNKRASERLKDLADVQTLEE